MNRRLTAIVEREVDGYVALCPELDIASQGGSVTEARDNLAEALVLFFETAPSEEVNLRLRVRPQDAGSQSRMTRKSRRPKVDYPLEIQERLIS